MKPQRIFEILEDFFGRFSLISGLFTKLFEGSQFASDARGEEPIRGEMCSSEGLEQFAAALAVEHNVSAEPQRGRKLLLALEEKDPQLQRLRVERSGLKARQYWVEPLSALNTRVESAIAMCSSFAVAIHNGQAISPAARWLVDNLTVVEEHLQEICKDLPRYNYDELPKLKAGDLAGFPRIYAIALALTAHINNCLDIDTLRRFILTYQRVTPLTISELWGLAVTLRLVLTENLQRLATRIVTAHEQREEAMENILTSMRLLSTLNWSAFFESVSPVDLVLCKDPVGTYPLMEFATRDCYRHVIEHIAKQTNAIERDIAQRVIELASESRSSHPNDEYLAHVGYYLIDAGRTKLEEIVGYQPRCGERFSRAVRRNPTTFCFGLLSLLTAFILALFLLYASHVGAPTLMLAWLLMLLLIPASELALNALNTILIFKPSSLPKMDFGCGVPEELQTMVVVPTIFSSERTIHELLETIEAHYLANQDDHIYFALLGDWSDASQEKMPNDDALLNTAINGIKELNARYHQGSQDRFYLFHRRRQWNKSEEKWIGWERKRGKLREFNRLLRGARDTSYIVCTADQAFLAQIRYVITLDSDTQLPRDAARRLIGTISHPLIRPKSDVSTGRVMRGYIIIQPHVSNLPPIASRSRIPRILSNYIRVNPGVKAVPDVYQNLFDEGIYIGKGLYDVDAFEAVLKDRIPENSLLSHDLYEGLYARTALITDIEVSESRRLFYEGFVKRLHRWIRGDWQLLPWLLPYVREAHGRTVRNVLPAIARWKILDNLRRSLFPLTMFLWLAAAWTVLPGSPASWMLLISLVFAFSISLPIIKMNLLALTREIPRTSLFESIKYIAKFSIVQVLSLGGEALFLVIFLAHQSYLRADGVIRTLYRMIISRKHLLEWGTAAQAQKDSRHDLRMFLCLMWPVIMITLILGVLIFINKPAAIIPAAPFLLTWLVSPLVAYWLNRQVVKRNNIFEPKVEHVIRLNGRRMWRDLERFINNENHWLSLGVYQEKPKSILAHHTLSTNLLRFLLWTVTAHELGCIGTIELAERLELIFTKIAKPQSLCGHHRHCDDPQVLKLFAPQHILASENGNLAGHLTTLKQVCIEIANRPLFDERVLKGCADTISLMKEEITHGGPAQPMKGMVIYRQLHEEIEACATLLSAQEQGEVPRTVAAWDKLFNSLAQHAAIADNLLNMLLQEHSAGNRELRFWTDSLIHQTREFNRDLHMLAPWTSAHTADLRIIINEYDATALEQWDHITEILDRVPVISRLPEAANEVLSELVAMRMKIDRRITTTGIDRAEVLSRFDVLVNTIEEASTLSKNLLSRYTRLAQQSEAIMESMGLWSLFDEERYVSCIN